MKYRVWAESISYVYLDVDAESEDESREIAEEADGGEFECSAFGDWFVTECEELADELHEETE